MASLYKKIKNALAIDEACAITERGVSVYAVVRWDAYQELLHTREEYRIMLAAKEDERAEEGDIDINRIPV